MQSADSDGEDLAERDVKVSFPTQVGEFAELLGRAESLEAVDAKGALELARMALIRASSADERVRATLSTASILRRLGDYAEARDLIQSRLVEAESLGDLRLLADFLYVLGRIHWNLTDYPASIEVHLRELALAEQLQDPLRQSKAHTGLGLTLSSFGEAEQSSRHLRDALVWAEQSGDPEQLAITLNSLGNHLYSEGEFGAASEYHARALVLRREMGSVRGVADSLNNLALIAQATGEPDRALRLFGEAQAIYERLDLKRYLANVHRRIGSTLRDIGKLDEAQTHLEVGLKIADQLGSAEVLINIYRELATLHEARGQFDQALRFERLRAAATEEARTVQDRGRIAELNARYEAERRDHEIDLLRRDQALQSAEIRRRRLVGWFLGAGLGVLAIGSGAAVVVQRSRLRQERRVRSATEDARDRAEEAEHLKSRLLQIASHDLKAPLAALSASARRIESHSDAGSLVGRLAAGIHTDASRMDLLVRDLLDSVAMESQQLQLHPTEFDLTELCGAVVERIRGVAVSKDQSLAFEHPTNLPMIWADRDRLWQILDNLIGNALKFTPRGGRVVVRAEGISGWFTVEVEDSGPGLTPADLAHVFGPYQQLSARPTGGEHSTGLGLHITRELVAIHRGRLEVESQPGKGAIFRVLLPTGKSAETAEHAPANEGRDVVEA